MHRTLTLVLFISFLTASYSQIVTITNAESGEPVYLATLTCENQDISAITNVKGQADISAFSNTEKIEIRSLGYLSKVSSFQEIEAQGLHIQLKATNLNLDEIVVSANRWWEASSNVPSKIVTISPKEALLMNPQTAADLLGLSGKVYIQKSQQGGGSPMIRGFATNRLLYAVDGVRMNTAIYRSGNIQNVINLDPFVMENTEILFGPGSVIYGSDAIGGVMSFQTLSPQFSLNEKPLVNGKAITRFATANNEKTAHFDVNVGWKKWSFITSFSTWDYDHLKQGGNGPNDYLKTYFVERHDSSDVVLAQSDPLLQVPSAYSQYNIMQKARFQPNKNWNFEYGFHYSETSPYGRYDRHNRVRNGIARYAEWNYGPQKWMMNNLSIIQYSKNLMYDQLAIRLARQEMEESRIDRSLNKTLRNTQTENVEAFSANIDFIKAFGNKHTFFYGLEYVFNDISSEGEIADISSGIQLNGPSRYPQSDWTSLAIYINDEYKISNALTIQSGLRYNEYFLNADFNNNLAYYPFPFDKAKIQDGALTGSIGAVWRPGSALAISTNLGSAFRSPNIDDIGKVFDSEPGAITVPNPDLQAEFAYNADLGIAKVIANTVKLDLTGFYTLLNNAMVRRNYSLDGMDSILYDGEMSRVQAVQNTGITTVYGLQAGLEAKLPIGFSISTNLNYQVGEEELDNGSFSPSRHAAPLYGNFNLNYVYNQLSIKFYSDYQAEKSNNELPLSEKDKDEIYAKDKNGLNYAPSWYTLNVKAIYTFSKTFSISSGLENITDQRYRPYSSGISAPGRNFVISLKAEF